MNAFNSSGGYSDFTIGRKEEILIEAFLAKDILNLISKCMSEGLGSIYCTDSGSWKMTVFNSDKNNDRYDGSLTGGLVIDHVDLTDYIQKYIPIDSLFVFGDTFE